MAILLTVPVWADEDLNPAPLHKEIEQYKGFWKSNDVDPVNHEVWKLYIFGCLAGQNNMTTGGQSTSPIFVSSQATQFQLVKMSDVSHGSPDALLASLTPDLKSCVLLQINNLYNFFQTIPGAGDVIVIEGRVLQHSHDEIVSGNKTFSLDALLFYAENGQKAVPGYFKPIEVDKTLAAPTPLATLGFFRADSSAH